MGWLISKKKVIAPNLSQKKTTSRQLGLIFSEFSVDLQ